MARPLPTRRFDDLATVAVLGIRVPEARGPRARLLGLAFLDRAAAGPGLLIPRCAGVHTFGMRFPLDLLFLDRHGEPRSIRRGIPPRRFVCDRRAVAVLELPSHTLPPAPETRDLRLRRPPRGERSRRSPLGRP